MLAYGQTGSGKTFSMSGPSLKLSSEQQSAAGLIPRAVKASDRRVRLASFAGNPIQGFDRLHRDLR